MARVPYLNQDDLAEEHRHFLARPANLFRALVHSPEGYRQWARLGGWIRNGSTLDPRLRELAILQVGATTGCAYEYSHHVRLAREFGCSDEDIRAVAADAAGEATHLGPTERAVLRLAREMTTQLQGSDEAFDAVRAALGEEHLVDLLITIGFYNMVVRMLLTLDVDVEEEYLPLLDAFPLPAAR